jgi:hypothetical protein
MRQSEFIVSAKVGDVGHRAIGLSAEQALAEVRKLRALNITDVRIKKQHGDQLTEADLERLIQAETSSS